ncbi:ABC transporter substrate-binding protein [Curtobacterium sp. NPDC090217]|uniref:ABC transporter substrate-binding protein n=1 Tax=Curtobacterium sp. NPDC090217 TaxID=3363970 RepID=UPI003811A605
MRRTHSKAAAVAVIAALAVGLTACSTTSSASTSTSSKDYGTLTAGTLKIGTLSDAKPYAYTENGKLTGFEVDMATAIAKHLDLKPVFVQQEFSTLLPAVAAGSLDVAAASTSVTPERKKSVDFSNTYFIGYISIITPSGSTITKKASSLKGKRLGLMQGTLEDQYAQDHFPGVQIVRYPDNNAAKAAMQAGSIDAVFLDYPIGQDFVDKDDSIKMPINIELPEYPVAMSMHKDKPALKKGINTAIKEIIASGEWLEIEKKYYPDAPVPDQFQPTDK